MISSFDNLNIDTDNLNIDTRSFRAFEALGRKWLYDRATGAVVELDDYGFAIFSLLQAGKSIKSIANSCFDGSEETMKELNDLVQDLMGKGFFQYAHVSHAEQEQYISSLMRHKPRRIQLLMAQGCNLEAV